MRRSPLFLALPAFLLLCPGVALGQSSASGAAPSVLPSFGEKLHLPGLPHAGKISAELYRGAQPRAGGFAQLKKIGITTIVDLRREDPGKRQWERLHAEALGIHFLSIPVGGWSPPADKQVAQFLALFGHGSQQKIFVHCEYGDDRTGVFIAAYRIAYDHWSTAAAIKEMYFFGFHGFWHPSMESYVRNFPAHLEISPDLQPFRTAGAPQAANNH